MSVNNRVVVPQHESNVADHFINGNKHVINRFPVVGFEA